MEKLQIGAIVYVNSTYNTAEKCKVTGYGEENGKEYYKIHSIDNCGDFGALPENIYLTRDAALRGAKKASEELVCKYKSEIKNLQDLLQFPLNHCFCGDEYTDWEAIEAYKIRVKELTGLVLTQ